MGYIKVKIFGILTSGQWDFIPYYRTSRIMLLPNVSNLLKFIIFADDTNAFCSHNFRTEFQKNDKYGIEYNYWQNG